MKTFAFVLLVLILPLFIFSLNLYAQVFNDKFYFKEFEKNNVYSQIEKDDVAENCNLLIGFFKGKNNLDSTFFNEKERKHLLDVNSLIIKLRYFIYALAAILLSILVYFIAGKDYDGIKTALLFGSILAIAVMAFFIVFMLFDFTTLFVKFHLISFSNDLWQLNPASDKLIVMFPEGFFFDSAINLIISSFITIIAIFVIVLIIRSTTRHSQRLQSNN